jgi:hypothetical protein
MLTPCSRRAPALMALHHRAMATAVNAPATNTIVLANTLSKTSQGIAVASVEDGSPVSTVAIVFKAGSRFDPATAPGTAHLWQSSLIRVCAAGVECASLWLV